MSTIPMREANIKFLVYGGSETIPVYLSDSIEECLAFMRSGGLSSLQCYTIRAMETDSK